MLQAGMQAKAIASTLLPHNRSKRRQHSVQTIDPRRKHVVCNVSERAVALNAPLVLLFSFSDTDHQACLRQSQLPMDYNDLRGDVSGARESKTRLCE